MGVSCWLPSLTFGRKYSINLPATSMSVGRNLLISSSCSQMVLVRRNNFWKVSMPRESRPPKRSVSAVLQTLQINNNNSNSAVLKCTTANERRTLAIAFIYIPHYDLNHHMTVRDVNYWNEKTNICVWTRSIKGFRISFFFVFFFPRLNLVRLLDFLILTTCYLLASHRNWYQSRIHSLRWSLENEVRLSKEST